MQCYVLPFFFVDDVILAHNGRTHTGDGNGAYAMFRQGSKKVKVAHTRPITERMVPELIPVLGSQPAGDMSHKPGSRLPLLSARPAVTPATLKRAATNFAAW